ncbi:MAG: hypothetical protein AVDCRST_MAG20-2487, partial [uncultured Acidimicrobiales bacterium]
DRGPRRDGPCRGRGPACAAARASARRPARTRRRRRPAVPRRPPRWWLPRRRPLLRAVRLPHHVAAPPRGRQQRPDHPLELLGAPGATAAAGHGGGPGGGRRVRPLRGRHVRARPDPGRRHRDHRLRRQLAGDLRRPGLLGPLRRPVAAPAHVERGHRGAVLPAVAARHRRAAPLAGSRPAAVDRARHRAGPRSDLSCLDGAAVRPRRQHPGLLRHGHPGGVDPRGGSARGMDSGAGAWSAAPGGEGEPGGRPGRRRGARLRLDPGRGHLCVAVPGRDAGVGGRRGGRHRRRIGSRTRSAPTCPQRGAAAVARPHQLRHVPVALADLPGAQPGTDRHRRLAARGAADHGDARSRHGLVHRRRAAGPPGHASPHRPAGAVSGRRRHRRGRTAAGDERGDLGDAPGRRGRGGAARHRAGGARRARGGAGRRRARHGHRQLHRPVPRW